MALDNLSYVKENSEMAISTSNLFSHLLGKRSDVNLYSSGHGVLAR
jgi:hypothetical protein